MANRPVEVDNNVEKMWRGLKECFLGVAEEVCGNTRGRQRHSETWWWNDEVAKSVEEKRRLFRIYDIRESYQSKERRTGRGQMKTGIDMLKQSALQGEKLRKRRRLRGGSLPV